MKPYKKGELAKDLAVRLEVADPEKFKRWYTLYRLGVRHRAGT